MKKVLLNHGYTNKRPAGHWLRLTAAELRNRGHQVWYPQYPAPDEPVAEDWQNLIAQEAAMMDEVHGGEKIAICHSLGCVNWLVAAQAGRFEGNFDRVLLVAPPDPALLNQIPEIQGEPLNVSSPGFKEAALLSSASITLIASESDRWLPNGISVWEEALGLNSVILQGAGHFSLDDGFGPWSGLIHWIESGNVTDLTSR